MTVNLEKYKDKLLFLPIGGTEQIGLNLYMYHYNGKWIIVDFGLGFADEHYPGVEVLVPDISFIQKYRKDVLGLVLTHAHEDHIGALQYLWGEVQLPIYASKFTTAVVKSKLAESGLAQKCNINVVKPNTKFKLGEFEIEFIGLTHSIPEMNGLMIRTPSGNIFHTGDWKFDDEPVIGKTSNIDALKRIGDEGVLAMICDSTNIFSEGHSGSEGSLVDSFKKLFAGQKNLIVVSSFASNIARIHTIAKAAQLIGRKVALSGTSLWRMYEAALDCGYLDDLDSFIKTRDISKYNKKDIVVIATGCQGEPRATMAKLSREEHPDFRLSKNDLVIFSSRIIPGNEKKIFRLFNKFCKRGIEVLTEKDHFVHVSGHPAREEVSHMYSYVRPTIAIPMHGEPMHIHEHTKFAKEHGAKFALHVENGYLVDLNAEKPTVLGQLATDVMAVDGNFVIPASSEIMSLRRRMRDNGAIFVTCIFDKAGRLLKDPTIIAPGSLDSLEDKDYFAMLREQIKESISMHKRNFTANLEDKIHSIIKNFYKAEINKQPKIFVQIEKLDI
ncbi:MAG: ribonuclease J [Rickettsiales bacterium]